MVAILENKLKLFYTREETQSMLGVGAAKLKKMEEEGLVSYIIDGRTHRFYLDDILTFMREKHINGKTTA